ncbi:Metallo-beta-lactamase superfamily protein [Legionella quinlivanii]|uniref:Metallo-beta-lactamase superfamily protein n=1 Tax=Legionella quinlivanii TaxID=45073 RepID=A0A0W0XKQ6_9GAMM|nr:MBL fold metallo-hydrolase [Legionella quinlivanii]KTD45207.1 Metallo-beta-lactamase superfamily protein [Legionella quinlivanii]SEG05138.1 Metallo-beta-lactamase superfamily protein [Legionella quinlivanii DSM 21216]STY11493.1 Metallo-beta-lactamase superfamily [Legionella quinlivanii]
MLKYLDSVELAKQYFLIIGRHLDLERKQADVANAIVYKKGDTLYLIDTGALPDFRQILLDKCALLQPVNRLILVNTHGHIDHVGNNIVIDQIEAFEKYHYISAHDLTLMQNNRNYFIQNFKNIMMFMAKGFNPEKRVDELLKFFEPVHANTQHLNVLESLPSHNITIGHIYWSGWKFDEGLYVLRSEGHTRGHVIVYLPEISHIHMGDETNGYCNLFHDCDHLKSLESHTKVLSMLNEGSIKSMTDGHSFQVYNQEQAKIKLEELINAHYVYENTLRGLLLKHSKGLTFKEIQYHLDRSEQLKSLAKTGNPNPIFNTLMVLSKLRDFGILPEGENLEKSLFKFQGFHSNRFND